MKTVPSAEQYLIDTGQSWDNMGELMCDYVSPWDLNKFATQVLEYNLKRYREQMLDFNQGEATKYKSIDTVTQETIRELQNRGSDSQVL